MKKQELIYWLKDQEEDAYERAEVAHDTGNVKDSLRFFGQAEAFFMVVEYLKGKRFEDDV